jgi:hypothetical protein
MKSTDVNFGYARGKKRNGSPAGGTSAKQEARISITNKTKETGQIIDLPRPRGFYRRSVAR